MEYPPDSRQNRQKIRNLGAGAGQLRKIGRERMFCRKNTFYSKWEKVCFGDLQEIEQMPIMESEMVIVNNMRILKL